MIDIVIESSLRKTFIFIGSQAVIVQVEASNLFGPFPGPDHTRSQRAQKRLYGFFSFRQVGRRVCHNVPIIADSRRDSTASPWLTAHPEIMNLAEN